MVVPPVPFLIYIYIEDCSGDRQCAFPDPRLLSRANNKSQDLLDMPAYKLHDLRKKIALLEIIHVVNTANGRPPSYVCVKELSIPQVDSQSTSPFMRLFGKDHRASP